MGSSTTPKEEEEEEVHAGAATHLIYIYIYPSKPPTQPIIYILMYSLYISIDPGGAELRVVVIAGAGRARSAHSSASSSLSPVATPPSYWHCCCGLRFFWHWPGRPADTLVKRKLAGLFHSNERCYVERVCWASQPASHRKEALQQE
jgi:hypothetical protein